MGSKVVDILAQAKSNPAGVRFAHLVKLVLAMGYELKRQNGSHRVFGRAGFPTINLQPDGNKAKDYQVRQVVAIIEERNIEV